MAAAIVALHAGRRASSSRCEGALALRVIPTDEEAMIAVQAQAFAGRRRLTRRCAQGVAAPCCGPRKGAENMVQDLDLLRLERRVEQLIARWDRADTPGCTVGLVRGGALVVHRSAGQANLDLGVPIGPETTFRVASVTKQFTCMAALLLAAGGKLRLDADIREYLPDLPDFGARITPDHLMRNVSGIRDFLELMRLGGLELGQPCRIEDIMAVLARQRGLNFPPGSRFLYSNTGFMLLGQIIAAVSGESFGAFVQRRVLDPLGMTRSRIVASTAETVPGLATGYFAADRGGFVKAQHGFPLGGEGGLVSCVRDLALWDRNFSSGRIGGVALVQALQERAAFTNGRMNHYARGIALTAHRGLSIVSHGGLWPGYRTEFLRLPERDLTIICIANLGTIDPHRLARQVADAVLVGEAGVAPAPELPDRASLAKLEGRYVDPDAPATAEISLNEGVPFVTINGVPFRLVPTTDGRLAAASTSFEFTIQPREDGLEVELDAGARARYHGAHAESRLPENIAGTYECAELGATWRIAPEADGRMTVRVSGPVANAGPWDVTPVEGDIFRIWTPGPLYRGWVDVRALRDGGRITALHVNGARARNQVFSRACS